MTKVTLNDLVNLQNEGTAVSTINGNSATIETAFDNTLSRDGSAPNTMLANLDMNSNRILNLVEAVAGTEPVRKAEFDTLALAGAATISVGTTTTLASGSPATVTNGGTAYNQILNFGIPKGVDGAMTGPVSSTTDNITTFNGSSGTTVKDSGVAIGTIALKAPLASPTFTGTPAAPTAAVDTNTTQLATTAFVLSQAAAATPQNPGTAAVGSSTRYARADHVHNSDTTKSGITRTLNGQAGTTYTFVIADAGAVVYSGSTSATTFTIPLNSSVAYPTGTQIDLMQANTGKLTIAATGGVTLASFNSNKSLAGTYATATLLKTGTDVWILFGSLIT